MGRGRALLLVVLAVAAATAFADAARASEIVTRNASHVSLKVDKAGYALVTYTSGGKVEHVLYWGAINAKPPKRGTSQVAFKRDFAGGWGTFHTKYWKTMMNACGRYDGPELAWLVTACKAPDGSYWALQSWQRMLPDLGETAWKPSQSAWELHISHWTGDLAQLRVYTDWSYHGRFHHLFGTLTYDDQPVHGFASSSSGNPLDSFGRNLYLDTLNSAYGSGWKRENSFLAHVPSGSFCYGFYPHPPYPGYPAGSRPAGNGERYRLTVIGPGVTPDVMWTGDGLPDYDPGSPDLVQHETEMNTLEQTLSGPDKLCRHE